MEFTVKTITETRLRDYPLTGRTQILTSKLNLEIPILLDKATYIDDNDAPTLDGVKMMTVCMVSGLAAHVHCAADAGLWDRAAHMRHIFSALEDLFVAQGESVDKKNL